MAEGSPTVRVPGTRRIVVGAAAALIAGGTIIGASGAANAADAAGSGPAPVVATGVPSHSHAHIGGRRGKAVLRGDIRAVPGGTPHEADRAAVAAIEFVDFRPNRLAKLPGSLQSELKTLEAALAADRVGDVQRIKAAALEGA